ncbi:hypothetical protein AM1BK_41580 [Neobacillus kokaensis]|uniref:Uncharacterized protein n=2 Tax=Neobacillus kokaensis TaxID=2759023 RepID=A0ABQ3NAI7_9BACI|nr:hypothetical protein AM1BK_41580 [Neobacillus kokaensis]
MKVSKSLAISLLLTFLTFSIFHGPKTPPTNHTEGKASIFFGEWKVKAQWDDEKKQPINMPDLFVLFFILSTIGITVTHFTASLIRNTSFLIPIFHQSNYLILAPKLLS